MRQARPKRPHPLPPPLLHLHLTHLTKLQIQPPQQRPQPLQRQNQTPRTLIRISDHSAHRRLRLSEDAVARLVIFASGDGGGGEDHLDGEG